VIDKRLTKFRRTASQCAQSYRVYGKFCAKELKNFFSVVVVFQTQKISLSYFTGGNEEYTPKLKTF